MDRFDMPVDVRNVVIVATEKGVVDGVDLYTLAAKHGDAWKSLVNELCEIAYASRHGDKSKHEAVVKAAEEVWKRIYA